MLMQFQTEEMDEEDATQPEQKKLVYVNAENIDGSSMGSQIPKVENKQNND
jgi:hypothetical protein